jgi:hypothetical protein
MTTVNLKSARGKPSELRSNSPRTHITSNKLKCTWSTVVRAKLRTHSVSLTRSGLPDRFMKTVPLIFSAALHWQATLACNLKRWPGWARPLGVQGARAVRGCKLGSFSTTRDSAPPTGPRTGRSKLQVLPAARRRRPNRSTLSTQRREDAAAAPGRPRLR